MVFNAVKTHFRQVEATAGVAGAQVWALSVIQHEPGIGVGGLARAMDIHQSTASNLLKPLIDKGMVAADRQGADRRTVHLHISAKGVAVLRKAPGPFAGVLPEALSSMDAATLSRLDRDLSTLCQRLGADTRGGAVPLGQPTGWNAAAKSRPPRNAAAKQTTAPPRKRTQARPAAGASAVAKSVRSSSRT